MSDDKHLHVPYPKSTSAFVCAECGAVSLLSDGVCKPQGRGTKADWCGSNPGAPPSYCRNAKHTERYQCKNCGQVAVNPGLLCAPEKIEPA
jgi:predicted RNA-binding Zn-ribbon protein involved in translation (DUF1610 family)